MSKAMPTASSPAMVESPELVDPHRPAPPSYERTMGQGGAPYPHQNIGMGPGMVSPPMQHVPPPQQFSAVPPSSTTVILTGAMPMGPDPANMRCPNCNMNITTTTVSENSSSAHIACILLFLFGCCLCSCIPYFMDAFKVVNHSCPNCKTFLGSYKS